jgi:hypothetical protein
VIFPVRALLGAVSPKNQSGLFTRPFFLIFDDKDNDDLQLSKPFYTGETPNYETQHSNHQYCIDCDWLYHRPAWGQFIHSNRKRNGTGQRSDADRRNITYPWDTCSGYCNHLVSGRLYRRQVEESLGKVK